MSLGLFFSKVKVDRSVGMIRMLPILIEARDEKHYNASALFSLV